MNKEKKDALLALNSINSSWLPIGNKELMEKIKKYGISYNHMTGKWN
jgi:hypothetical protein